MAESDDQTLTPQEMRDWLVQEMRDLTKAIELRIGDATDFVTAYALGELTAKEALDRLLQYESRWGDSPILGTATGEDMTNEQIVSRVDMILQKRKGRSGPSMPSR